MLWGSAFPFIKIGYQLFSVNTQSIPSILLFAGLRFTISGIVLLLVGSITQKKLLLLPKGKIGLKILGLGLLQTTGQYMFFYFAVSQLTGKVGSLLNSTTSFTLVILAHFMYKDTDKLTKRKIIGCIIGFSGVILACISPDNSYTYLGVILMLIASLFFTFSSPANKHICKLADSLTVSGWNLFFGGFVLLCVGICTGGTVTITNFIAFLDLGVLCFISSAGYLLNAILVKNNPISRIGVFCMCIPITTSILSAILFPETSSFTITDLLALLLVCIGIFYVNKPKNPTTNYLYFSTKK